MKLNLPSEILKLFELFAKKGFEIYVVGGAVRDLLLGNEVNDWDFTTSATPGEILKILPKDAFYGNDFGTVMLPIVDLPSPVDITTFRTEHGYSDNRRPDKVLWGKTLEEDLVRRDFTINAMAIKKVSGTKNSKGAPKDFEIIDPHKGQQDLAKKIIRAVGDANERFAEDALRMLRAIRIAGELKFKIEKATLQAIQANVERIHNISKERVKDELFKILSGSRPYEGFLLLKESGLMDEILPELTKAFGVEQKSPSRHHKHDVGTHSLLALKFVAEINTDPVVRFATLIHDIGKPLTYKKLTTGVVTFYNHEVISARIAKNIAARLKFSNKETEKLWRLVRWHQFTVNENQTDKALRRFIVKVGLENVPDMLDLRTGDRLGGGATETSWRTEEFKKRLIDVQKQPFTVRDLKVTGNDVMKVCNLKPGPKIGEILADLFKEVENGTIPNDKDTQIKYLNETKQRLN